MADNPDVADPREDAEWTALARYMAGESPPDEIERVEEWLAHRDAEQRLVRMLAPSDAIAMRPIDVEGALAQTRQRIAAMASDDAGTQPVVDGRPQLQVVRGGLADGSRARTDRASRLDVDRAERPAFGSDRTGTGERGARPGRAVGSPWRIRTWAAAAALLVGVGYAGSRVWQANPRDGIAADGNAPRVIATAVGVRDSVTLADGSKVVLAPGSRLTIDADYDRTRRVTLDGAAFFTVRHDEAHPFTVRSNGAEIVDVGTVFTVRDNADGSVAVAVTEGEVNLRRVRDTAVAGGATAVATTSLRAGDRASMPANDGETTVERGTVTDDDIAWVRGSLVYRDAPLSVIQADLERWYGLRIRIADPALAAQTVTTSFSRDSSAQVVRKLALVLGADATVRGDTVLLSPAGAPPPR